MGDAFRLGRAKIVIGLNIVGIIISAENIYTPLEDHLSLQTGSVHEFSRFSTSMLVPPRVVVTSGA